MAASVTYSVWAENNLAFVNFSWQADSGGLCNSLGIISSITGRVFGIRLVTYNVASGYAPHSGYSVKLMTGADYDVCRSYGGTLASSSNLLTRYFNQSSLDFFLMADSLRLQVTSGGDNRVGKVQLALSYDW